jgi:hypothetical protein
MSHPLPLPTIPPKPMEPIRYLDGTDAEHDAIAALVHNISTMLRGAPAVVKSHTTVDYVDVEVENGTFVRVSVQALRR